MTRFWSRTVLLAAIATLPLIVPATTAAAKNVASGRMASASSTKARGHEPRKAVDTSSSTSWSSKRRARQYWQVDLGRVRQIDGVEVDWTRSYASRYRVQTSRDGRSFTTAAGVRISAAGPETTRFAARSARYVRVAGVTRGASRGISFRNVKVLAVDAAPPTAPAPSTTPSPSPAPSTAPAPSRTPAPSTTPAPSQTPAPGTAPGPAPSGSLLWSADMEEGTLSDWSFPEPTQMGRFGGGEYNSGGGDSTVTTEEAHSGRASAKLVLNGSGGTRLFRWQELRENREAFLGAWFNFPKALTLTGDPSDGRFLILFQFKSRSSAGAIDPIWYLDVSNPSPGRMRLDLVWWHRTLEGPRLGQSGFRRYTQTVADVPVGRWFELKAQLRQSKDFDGALRVWQDDKLLFDMPNVRTSYANCAFNPWCTSNEWAVNNYSDGVAEWPAVIYVDDARIARP